MASAVPSQSKLQTAGIYCSSRIPDNCEHCGGEVVALSNGSYRNHCPFCLSSKHVDNAPGDRQSTCSGLMQPIGLRHKSGKGLQIVHQCLECGKRSANRFAENTKHPDDIDKIVKL